MFAYVHAYTSLNPVLEDGSDVGGKNSYRIVDLEIFNSSFLDTFGSHIAK